METLQGFFGAGSQLETIYWILASVSTGFLSFQILMNLIGMDFDHGFDLDVGVGDVSLSGVLALFAIGGWTGVLAYRLTDLSPLQILGVALVAGILGLVATAIMMKSLKKLEEHGNLDFQNAIGKTAEVYLKIPAENSGTGQIQMSIQGRWIVLDAVTDSKEALKTGTKVIIYAANKGTLSVEPMA